MKETGSPKIAIVHDWLVGGGAERVVGAMHELYPDAPIYTSYCSDEWRNRLHGRVRTGFLQQWPFSRLRKYCGLLRIWWFGRLDLRQYDIVISSSGNGEAKAVRVRQGALHVVYCHAPTHFYWRHHADYLARPGFGALDPLARLCLRLLVNPLRKWDKAVAQRPDIFIANSTHTQQEIKTYYQRDSAVVHPPVDIERFSQSKTTKRVGFVTAGRQTPYKHTEILIAACTQLQEPLIVIGNGPEHEKLKRLAGPTVQFLTNVSDEEMGDYLANAKAFLFAAYEDFGVTPVEAMAAGTPVIAYGKGGALDYVTGKTGVLYQEQNAKSLIAAIQEFRGLSFDEQYIKKHANQFRTERFQQELHRVITKTWEEKT